MSVGAWRGHAPIALVARLYLGSLFLFACWHKIADPHAFAVDIATYRLLPLVLVNFFAIVLPWVELATGTMLVLGLRTRAASLLAAVMLAMFTAAISIAVAQGLDLTCGCFASQGAAEDPISWRTIVRDGDWLLLAAAKLGGFWPFALLLYSQFDKFTPAILPEWAERAGLDRVGFERLIADPKTRDERVDAKQEGLRNKVDSTPSLFIDGCRYVYDVNVEAILDVLQEAADRSPKKLIGN